MPKRLWHFRRSQHDHDKSRFRYVCWKPKTIRHPSWSDEVQFWLYLSVMIWYLMKCFPLEYGSKQITAPQIGVRPSKFGQLKPRGTPPVTVRNQDLLQAWSWLEKKPQRSFGCWLISVRFWEGKVVGRLWRIHCLGWDFWGILFTRNETTGTLWKIFSGLEPKTIHPNWKREDHLKPIPLSLCFKILRLLRGVSFPFWVNL